MKKLNTLLILIIFFSIASGQTVKGYNEWVEESKHNIQMIPMYGHSPKTKEQSESDNRFIKYILDKEKTYKAGSERLVKLGFGNLYKKELQTAMERFNQAWLIDSTNANIFWGFGAVYYFLNAFDEAIKMYNLGLMIDSVNTNLITDLGSSYLALYNTDKTKKENLMMAVSYFEKSYRLNPKQDNTVYKLIVCSLFLKDCAKANKYLAECDALGGKPITKEFRNTIKKKCP